MLSFLIICSEIFFAIFSEISGFLAFTEKKIILSAWEPAGLTNSPILAILSSRKSFLAMLWSGFLSTKPDTGFSYLSAAKAASSGFNPVVFVKSSCIALSNSLTTAGLIFCKNCSALAAVEIDPPLVFPASTIVETVFS